MDQGDRKDESPEDWAGLEREIQEAWKEEGRERRARILWSVAILLVVSLGYRMLFAGEWGRTAAMFVGLPAILAIGLSYTPRAKTVTGVIMRGITFFLLLFGVLLVEGLVCLLMAAPLFYLIGLIVGICADRRRVQEDMNRFRCTVAGVFLLMASEGVVPLLSFERENEVVIERAVTGTLEEVRERILGTPDLATERLPVFLQLGFPVPAGIEQVGEGQWLILFEEGKDEPTELQVRVREEGTGRVRYVMGEDSTKISEWLTWHDGLWELKETGEGTVLATLTVRFRRELDPYWYFAPLEKHGVRKAAEYFADELLQGSGDVE